MDKTFDFTRFWLVTLVVLAVLFMVALVVGSVFWSLAFGFSSLTVACKLLANDDVKESSKI